MQLPAIFSQMCQPSFFKFASDSFFVDWPERVALLLWMLALSSESRWGTHSSQIVANNTPGYKHRHTGLSGSTKVALPIMLSTCCIYKGEACNVTHSQQVNKRQAYTLASQASVALAPPPPSLLLLFFPPLFPLLAAPPLLATLALSAAAAPPPPLAAAPALTAAVVALTAAAAAVLAAAAAAALII